MILMMNRMGLKHFLLSIALIATACEKAPVYVTPVLPPEDKPSGDSPSGDKPSGDKPSDGQAVYDFSAVTAPLNAEMIFTKGYSLRYQSVMQSFALNADGTMYGIQVGTSTNKYLLNVTHKAINSDSGKTHMQLPFAGHGGNMDVEHSGGKDYIWVGSYGTWNGSKYTNSQTIARIPFTAGGKLLPSECQEQFYIPGLRNVSPALDIASDRLMVWGLSNGESNTGYFKVYRLSEVMKLPVTEFKLERAVTFGGQDSGYPETTVTPTIRGRKIEGLTPVANIRLNGGMLGTGANQGFAIHGDTIVHFEGIGNDDNPALPSTSSITVLDLSGKILGHYDIAALADKTKLNELGITDTGFLEAEGVKIYDDILYLGYATKHSADNKRMVTIFKYDLRQKEL